MSTSRTWGLGQKTESSIWRALCYNFPIRCDCCHTQQRCALQRFIPAFLIDKDSTTRRTGIPYQPCGWCPNLTVISGIKTLYLNTWFRCWPVTELTHTEATRFRHQRFQTADAGGNPFPEAPVWSLPNLLSYSGGWTLICWADHLFSQRCRESTCAYLILFLSNKSLNAYFCGTRSLLGHYRHETQVRNCLTTQLFFWNLLRCQLL